MYVETDFLLALVKEEDWLGDAAEAVYRRSRPSGSGLDPEAVHHDYRDELWTSQFTLIELLVVAYRENRDTERVIANATELVEVRGEAETVVAAATYVEDHGFTPFDALHLVESDGDTIVSSDEAYDDFASRLDLRDIEE